MYKCTEGIPHVERLSSSWRSPLSHLPLQQDQATRTLTRPTAAATWSPTPPHPNPNQPPPYNSQPGLASQGVKPKVPEANMGKAEISIDLPACLPLSPPLYNCAANYAASLATRPALSRLENQEIFLFFRLVFLFFFFFLLHSLTLKANFVSWNLILYLLEVLSNARKKKMYISKSCWCFKVKHHFVLLCKFLFVFVFPHFFLLL